METIYTVIVVILLVLAILGLVVGVSNDAVNFLNSAIGSKAASRKVIFTIASVGILLGTMTSSGMMEVARSGVFYPEMFTFRDVMMLFLGVMFANVILLDLFNTFGLPTSTTVSLVFGLLGAAVAVTSLKISADPTLTAADMSNYINSGKALVIISGILASVAIAFVVGAFVMFISRLIFTFRYQKMLKRFGALWCGIAFTAIAYFALFKGLQDSGIFESGLFRYALGPHVPHPARFLRGQLARHVPARARQNQHPQGYDTRRHLLAGARLRGQRPGELHRRTDSRPRLLQDSPCGRRRRRHDDGQASANR